MSRLYSIVPFVVLATTVIVPSVALHAFGSVLSAVFTVIVLCCAVIVSDTSVAVHPLLTHVTVYVHPVVFVILAVDSPVSHI